MKTYVVGVVNLFDNNLLLEKIDAMSEIEALLKHSSLVGFEASSTDDIYQELFDCDIVAGVIEI